MHRTLLPALLLVACEGDDDTAPIDTDTETPPDDGDGYPDVMRDCPPTVGNICPWLGAGRNGWHPDGDAAHQLDQWFSFPVSSAFDPGGGRPVVFDWNNHKIRAVNANPEDGLETVMGTPYLGDGDPDALDLTEAGADGTTVALNHPTMGHFYSDGTLLAMTWHTHKMRTWTPSTGKVHVVLGSRPGWVVGGDFGQAESAVLMNQPKELFIDPTDENLVYYLDMRNERIRLWDDAGDLVNTIAGNGNKGVIGTGCETPVDDPLTVCCPPDPQPALADAANGIIGTCFNFPKNGNPEPGGAIAVNSDATLMYIADSESHVIRVLDLTTGMIDTLAGTPGTHGLVDGPVDSALFYYPVDFALDESTNTLFVADANNHAVRAIDLTANTVSTVAGTGSPSCDIVDLLVPATCDEQRLGGDGGLATEATVYRPFGVDLDTEGNLVIADTYNHRFRVVYR
jgi:hypothetical protein